jgi:hypothetical protein
MLVTVKTTGKHTIIVTFNVGNLVNVSYSEDHRKAHNHNHV